MRTVGIDYSLSSPCICIHDGPVFSIFNCSFHYLTSTKKYEGVWTQQDVDITGTLHLYFTSDEQRYAAITKWVLELLKEGDVICIEGYSMASTGRVFNIAENAGLLKHYLWKHKFKFSVVPPTVIKKFATGKGNANKEKLQESFIEETGVNIKQILNMTEKQWNPSSDIIDAYYLCKYGVENVT
jgi:Holliday junction resolvasome RuvABC endonuclease subunit